VKPQPSKNGLQPVPHIRKYCGLIASVNEMLQGTGSLDLAMRDIVNHSVFFRQRMKAGACPPNLALLLQGARIYRVG